MQLISTLFLNTTLLLQILHSTSSANSYYNKPTVVLCTVKSVKSPWGKAPRISLFKFFNSQATTFLSSIGRNKDSMLL